MTTSGFFRKSPWVSYDVNKLGGLTYSVRNRQIPTLKQVCEIVWDLKCINDNIVRAPVWSNSCDSCIYCIGRSYEKQKKRLTNNLNQFWNSTYTSNNQFLAHHHYIFFQNTCCWMKSYSFRRVHHVKVRHIVFMITYYYKCRIMWISKAKMFCVISVKYHPCWTGLYVV